MGVGRRFYGCYMTNWVSGQTNRFSAAVAMRPISNLVSEYAQHDIVLWGALELGPPPYPDLDELWRRSPIRYVQNIQTPLLLSCGEMDLRCAISQSEELFGAMRFLGKTVEMVRFPEESHDLSRNGRPDRRVERLARIAGWFERFRGTESTEKVAAGGTQVLPVHGEEEMAAPTAVLETVTLAVEPIIESAPTAVLEPLPVREEPEGAPVDTPEVADEAEPAVEIEPPAAADPYTTAALPVFPEPEPVAAEAMPPAEPEPAPEPEPEPEPAPVVAAGRPAPEPAPAPEAEPAAAGAEPAAAPDLQENGQSDAGEPATTIIPAWQPAEMPAESKRTVSLQAMPPEAIAAGEVFTAKLSFESGPFAGRIVALPNQMVTVGRAPDNDVVVGDPATSGRHGRIEVRAGSFWISDLGSTNGTLINGEPVIEKQLSDGDLITIGQNTIRFNLSE